MQKQLDWLDEIQPLSLDKDEMRKERILKQVTEQLPDTAESEKNIMKHTKLNKHIRPLIVIAAALGGIGRCRQCRNRWCDPEKDDGIY